MRLLVYDMLVNVNGILLCTCMWTSALSSLSGEWRYRKFMYYFIIIILRKKSREVTASLLGRFLSRHCFTLCITMEVEPKIAKQYKCHHCYKNYRGKGMEGGEKSVFALFFGWPEDRDFMEKMHFVVFCGTSNKLLLVARHILTTGLQKCL